MDKRAAVEEKLFFSDGTGSCFFSELLTFLDPPELLSLKFSSSEILPIHLFLFFTLVQTEVPEEQREHLDKQAPHEVKCTLIRQQRNVA